MATEVFPIKGIHCKSCKLLIESDIEEQWPKLKTVEVNIKRRELTLTGATIPSEKLVNEVLLEDGYEVGYEPVKVLTNDKTTILIALVTVALAVAGYAAWLLTDYALPFTDFFNTSLTQTKADDSWRVLVVGLLLGLTAGFSTCAALTGSLVASVGAKYAQENPDLSGLQKFIPHALFNVGRVIIFAFAGLLIGLVGSALALSHVVFGVFTVIVGVVMLLVGVQLSGVSPKLSIGFCGDAFAAFSKVTPRSHELTATLLGGLTILIPCGFTLTAELYAAQAGSILSSVLIMATFAVGTAPGLLVIGGFTSFINPGQSKFGEYFFQFIGVVVALFAVSTLVSGVQQLDLPNAFAADDTWAAQVDEDKTQNNADNSVMADQSQTKRYREFSIVYNGPQSSIDLSGGDIELAVGEAAIIHIKALEDGEGCMSAIGLPGLSASSSVDLLEKGQTIDIKINKAKKGTYKFKCAMGIPFSGVKVVVK